MERTFAILLASGAPDSTSELREALGRLELRVLAEESIGQEELGEAGLDLGPLRVTEERDLEAVYPFWVIQGEDAVRRLKDFQADQLDTGFQLIVAPTSSAASMVIELLFPSLDVKPSLSEPDSPGSTTITTLSLDATPTKPFPLSNLALEAVDTPASTSTGSLSPKIAQALARLETPGISEHEKATRRSFFTTEEEEDKDLKSQSESAAASAQPPASLACATAVLEREARPRSSTALSTSQSSTTSVSSSTSFKARPAPPPPTAQPRITKSAALRLGLPIPHSTPRTSSSSSLDTTISTPRAVPTPRSLAAPAIKPRLSRTTALRTGQISAPGGPPTRHVKRESMSTSERAALDRLTRRQSVQLPPIAQAVPEIPMSKTAKPRMALPLASTMTDGSVRSRQSTMSSLDGSDLAHQAGRRMSVSSSLKSLREPSVAPRSTKSSFLRTGTSTASPSISRNRPIAILDDEESDANHAESVPQPHRRRHSVQVHSTRPPAVEVRMSRTAMLRSGQAVAPTSSAAARTSVSDVNYDGVPGHKRRESVAVPSLREAPAHPPRPNRASLLRQKIDPVTSSSSTAPRRDLALHERQSSALASTRRGPSTTAVAPGSGHSITTPRSNRAAQLRQNAVAKSDAKEQQVPTTLAANRNRDRGLVVVGGCAAGTRSSSSNAPVRTLQKTTTPARPVSAMSDLSNGSKV